MILEGPAWVFGDNVNTDVMLPNTLNFSPKGRYSSEERRAFAFSGIRPGWSTGVTPGDLIVGGLDFGTGSARPAPVLIREIGIVGVIAESINGVFFRNCINAGLPPMECPGITELVSEGDRLRIDYATGEVTNLSTGSIAAGPVLPQELLDILKAGGILRALAADGYIDLPVSEEP